MKKKLLLPDFANYLPCLLSQQNWAGQQGRKLAKSGSNNNNKKINSANLILMSIGKSGIIKFEFQRKWKSADIRTPKCKKKKKPNPISPYSNKWENPKKKKKLPNIHISTITIIFTIFFAVDGCKEKFMNKAYIQSIWNN